MRIEFSEIRGKMAQGLALHKTVSLKHSRVFLSLGPNVCLLYTTEVKGNDSTEETPKLSMSSLVESGVKT